MAQQYLVDIGMHDSLDDIIRKCNHNFRTMSSSQRRQSRAELRTGLDDLDETINQELTQISNQLGEEASIRFNEDTRLQGEIDEIIAEGGTSDYNRLRNKPSIEGVTLVGNKSFEQLGLGAAAGEHLEFQRQKFNVLTLTAQQVANLLTDD